MKQNNLVNGVGLALLTAVISGVSIFYSKISLAKIDPLILTTSRNFFVAILFFSLFIALGKIQQLKSLKKSQIIPLLLIGIIGGGIPFYLFFSGLQLISAQSANMIQKSLFLWVAVLAVIFLKEKFNLRYLLSYVLIFAGSFLFTPIALHFDKGEFLILTAAILWASENVIAKKVLKNVSSELVGLFRMGIGSLILICLTFITGKSALLFKLNMSNLTTIMIGGILLSFYVYFWYRSLKLAPASLVTLLLTFSVVVGNILNGTFTGLHLMQKDILSSVCITAGAVLVLTQFIPTFIKRHIT